MMRRLFCIAVFFCFAVSFCLTPRSLFSGEGEKEALLNSLRRMQEDWIENASFCGHFTARSGDFTSEEEAMTAELPADAHSQSGFLAKLGHRYRCLSESGEDPENAVCIDSVSNDRFWLRIERRPESERFRVPYSSVLRKFSGDWESGLAAAAAVSDYAPWAFFDSVSQFTGNAAEDADIEYAPLEDGRVLLTFSREIREGVTESRALTVRTGPDRPTVEEFVRTVENPGMTIKIVTKALEWKDCGGFPAPARIRRTVHTASPAQAESVWNVVEWVSDDLGERPPRKSDFAVKVKFGEFVLHLKKPWWRRTVRIDALTDRNYDPEVPDFVTDPEKFPPPKHGLYFRWACAAAGLALIALSLVMKYRARKKRAASA